jgi:hypothetical protein
MKKYLTTGLIALLAALAAEAQQTSLQALETRYKNGEKNIQLLENLMVARNKASLSTDSLLDEYAKALPPDSLKRKRVILLLTKLSPIVGSAADSILRKDAETFSLYWFALPAEQRVAINNNIIRKSKAAAVKNRNMEAAMLAASFAKSTYFDPYSSERIYDQTMIEYFREAKDTAKYIPMAVYYYDKYFMTVPTDSVRLADQYSNYLKNAAWSFYTMTRDSAAISRAMNWAKRAIEFSELPASLDVYARLLYRSGNKADAYIKEELAVKRAKEKQLPSAPYEAMLDKMKSGIKVIDEYTR